MKEWHPSVSISQAICSSTPTGFPVLKKGDAEKNVVSTFFESKLGISSYIYVTSAVKIESYGYIHDHLFLSPFISYKEMQDEAAVIWS